MTAVAEILLVCHLKMQEVHLDNLGLLPKRKIWDSGGGGRVGETVSECMRTNIATACALDQFTTVQ